MTAKQGKVAQRKSWYLVPSKGRISTTEAEQNTFIFYY